MAQFLRAVLAVVLGVVVGSLVNMGTLMLMGQLVPPPAGADVTTMEGIKAALPLFEPKHFAAPFLAHALGTLVGALVAAWLAPSRSPVLSYLVGGVFLLGGIANAFMLPAPLGFIAVDLLLAYGPAAWLGHALAWRLWPRDVGVASHVVNRPS